MKDILRFLFKGEPPPTDEGPLDEINVIEDATLDVVDKREIADETSKFKLVAFCSKVLAAALLVWTIGIFILLFMDKEIPDWMPPIITLILGFFGGALAAYFDVKSSK